MRIFLNKLGILVLTQQLIPLCLAVYLDPKSHPFLSAPVLKISGVSSSFVLTSTTAPQTGAQDHRPLSMVSTHPLASFADYHNIDK